MPEKATVVIAAKDTALIESLRFALELEGFAVTVLGDVADGDGAPAGSCLVIDHERLLGLLGAGDRAPLRRFGGPVILLAGNSSQGLLARATAAGVTRVVEKPLLGGVLIDAIRDSLTAAKGAARTNGSGSPT